MSPKRRRRAGPRFLKALSEPPSRRWPEGAVHHGARVGLVVLLALAFTALFPTQTLRTLTRYQAGMVAEDDIVAEVGFDLPKSEEELERERAEAEATVPPIFLYRPAARDSMEARLTRFLDAVEEAVEAGGRQAVEAVLEEEGIPALDTQIEALLDPSTIAALRSASREVARTLTPIALDSNDALLVTSRRIVVRDEAGGERTLPADSLVWGAEFFNRAVERLRPAGSELQSLFRLIIIRYFESPYVLDVVATGQARNQARQAVPTTGGRVVPGQVLVRKGDPIGEEELARLTAYEEVLRQEGRLREFGRDWLSTTGSFVLNLLLLSLFGLLLFFFRKEVYLDFRWVSLLALLVLAYAVAAWAVAAQRFPWEILPIAFVVLPVAVLWDGRMALVLALVLGVLTGMQPPFHDFTIMTVTLVGGAAAALSARAVRRRSQTWIFIALITAGYFLALLSLGLLDRTAPGSLLSSVLLTAGNATASAILAMGFMPVFEWFTGITTDQTLLEWADPNRPLLKRLSLEAGGTYAHTINVANLAESAATAIGANGLLTRVGIYYHDVGKMLKPHFFVENQPGGRNPHDKLKPQTSAAIVREHVLEGERMAREEGVPDVIVRFIPEHHGTQLIGFFYEKAKEEAGGEPVDPAEFRYPGPKPQSKETAIAMLADSVESATRALQDPTPERVRDLVHAIVEGKVRDGQLAEAPLTLRELSLIEDQFVKAVTGMFHHRLDYPATRHITEAGTREKPASGGESTAAGGEPNRPRGPEAGRPQGAMGHRLNGAEESRPESAAEARPSRPEEGPPRVPGPTGPPDPGGA